MNTIAYFEIQAAQPDSVIAFHREVFGWQFTRAEGLPIPCWRIDTGGLRGGLLQRPAKTPPPECGTNASSVPSKFQTLTRRLKPSCRLAARSRYRSSPCLAYVGMVISSTRTGTRSGYSSPTPRPSEIGAAVARDSVCGSSESTQALHLTAGRDSFLVTTAHLRLRRR